MGATDFRTRAFGRTPEEAFRSAVESARWEHGHGGYSGTIAEKHGFSLVALPARMSAVKFEALVSEAACLTDDEWIEENLSDARRSGDRDWVKRAEAEAKQAQRERARLLRRVPAGAREAVERASRSYNDKWGPAVAVEVTGKAAVEAKSRAGLKGTRQRVFRFFGMASC